VKLTLTALALAAVPLMTAPAAGASAAGASAASAPASSRCGVIRASTPYSRHGHSEEWRVYRTGDVSCQTAERTLDAVMHLQAKQHVGASEAGSYFTYKGWTCPFGDMGQQLCDLFPGHSLSGHPRAQALALNCAVVDGGCPKRAPSVFG
jgi:hypothetical protein